MVKEIIVMSEDTQEEIERLKQQLEQVKLQDQILEEIEIKLNQMKIIAQYAADHTLSDKKHAQLNIKIQDYQSTIKELESRLVLIY